MSKSRGVAPCTHDIVASNTDDTASSPLGQSSASPANSNDFLDSDESDNWEDERDIVEDANITRVRLSSKHRKFEAPLVEDHPLPRTARLDRRPPAPEAPERPHHAPDFSSIEGTSDSYERYPAALDPRYAHSPPPVPGQWPCQPPPMDYAHYAHAGAPLVPYAHVEPYGCSHPYASHYGYPGHASPGYSSLSHNCSYFSEPRSLPYHYPIGPPGIATLEEDRFKKLEQLLQTQKEELLAMEKVRQSKLEMEKRDAEAELRRIIDERRAAQLVADAASKAKVEAEMEALRKAKALEAEHKVELDKQKAAAEKYRKEVEANKRDEDSRKGAVKFKDGVGRKFTFPFKVCKTWQGMEKLINQAFPVDDFYGQQVRDLHYMLVGPDNDIILPQVWESTVQPDWSITMTFWEPERPKPVVGAAPAFGRERAPAHGGNVGRTKSKSKGHKRDKSYVVADGAQHRMVNDMMPPPPPPPPDGHFDGPPAITEVLAPESNAGRARRRPERGGVSSFFAYAAGRRV